MPQKRKTENQSGMLWTEEDFSELVEMRKKEVIWIVPGEGRVTIFFNIHFDNEIDATICKLILNELEEAPRHV